MDVPEPSWLTTPVSHSVVRRTSQGQSLGGRGGAGNVFQAGSADAEAEAAKKEQDKATSAIADDESTEKHQSWAEKGKNLLFGKK